MLAELLPDIEPVEMVTVVPREANADGQLRLVYNEDRAACGTWSRRYLHQQTVMLMAARAAEMLECVPSSSSSSFHIVRQACC